MSPGLVRCTQTWDMHAYAIRASAYKTVAKVLTPFGKGVKVVSGPGLHTCDERLSEL